MIARQYFLLSTCFTYMLIVQISLALRVETHFFVTFTSCCWVCFAFNCELLDMQLLWLKRYAKSLSSLTTYRQSLHCSHRCFRSRVCAISEAFTGGRFSLLLYTPIGHQGYLTQYLYLSFTLTWICTYIRALTLPARRVNRTLLSFISL